MQAEKLERVDMTAVDVCKTYLWTCSNEHDYENEPLTAGAV